MGCLPKPVSYTHLAVLDAVIADAQMEIPDAMLETQQRQLLENFAQRIKAQGITLEQYMQFTGLTAQTMMEQLKPEALKRIQSRLVLDVYKRQGQEGETVTGTGGPDSFADYRGIAISA